MKIPTQAVPLAEITAGRPKESRKTEAPRHANRTGYETSHPAAQQTPNDRAGVPRRAPAPHDPSAQGSGKPGSDRRRGERRSANEPVLLDTRLPQVLRRKTDAVKISLKI